MPPPTQNVKPLAISAFGGSQSSGTINFVNGNGISFGLNAGRMTASVAPVNQTVIQSVMPIVGMGGVTAFTSNGSIVISGPTLTNIVAGAGIAISTQGNSVFFYTK